MFRMMEPAMARLNIEPIPNEEPDEEAEAELERARQETGLPAVDPVKHGVGALVDALD